MQKDILLKYFTISILLFTFITSNLSAALSSNLIEQDCFEGYISLEEAKILQAIAATKPDKLPDKYQSDEVEITKCGTELMIEAVQAMEANEELMLKYQDDMRNRPIKETVIVSPFGYFRLHYDTTGPHAVPLDDLDINGIPDYIDRAANFADSVWERLTITEGYLPPPSDGTQGGGSDQYDFYFKVMPIYGYATPELDGPEIWNDKTSHIVINSNFYGFPENDDPEGDQMGALKVTIAHEFFHAVQFAYDVDEAIYFMEMSSVWVEDFIYPQVNDNYHYLFTVFDEPDHGLLHEELHMYGAFIWPKYLEQRFGKVIMNNLWSECRFNSAIGAWSYCLDTTGALFEAEVTKWISWNYMTGSRNDGNHYTDGADYPQPQLMISHDIIPDSGNFSIDPPEPLGCNYIIVNNFSGYEGILTVDFTGMPTATWGLAYIIDYGSNQYHDTTLVLSGGTGYIFVPYFENTISLAFAPVVTSPFGSVYNYEYHLYMRPQGDADGDFAITISDAVQTISYIFANGDPSNPPEAMDADCNYSVDVSDPVYIIAYIFNGGPAPCEQKF